jgi:hypothetical protein
MVFINVLRHVLVVLHKQEIIVFQVVQQEGAHQTSLYQQCKHNPITFTTWHKLTYIVLLITLKQIHITITPISQ